MKKSIRLGKALNIFIAVAIIIPLIIISVFAMSYSRKFLIELSRNNNKQIVENLKANIEVFFVEPKNDLSILRDIVVSDTDPDKLHEIFTIYHMNQKQFNHYLVVEADGIASYSYPIGEKLVGFDYSNTGYYKSIRAGATEYWSPTYVDTKYNEISIDYAVPLDNRILVGTIHLEKLRNILRAIIEEEGLIVGITDSTGVYILHSDYNYVEQRFTDPYVNERTLDYTEVTLNNTPYYGTITDSDFLGWHIVLYEPVDRLNQKINRFIYLLTLIIVLSVLSVVLLGRGISNGIVRNLTQMVQRTRVVAAGDYEIDFDESRYVEFNEISSSFVQMVGEVQNREEEIIEKRNEIEHMNLELEKRVLERTQELQESNEKLGLTISNLETTKAQLVEYEKQASLGHLTSGLAHEINTPLGIILTTITYMKEETEKVLDDFSQNRLKKDDLFNYLESQSESEALILRGISRATKLVNSFKLVSPQQQNTEKRKIHLCDYLKRIIMTIETQLKEAFIEVRVKCEHDIEVEMNMTALYETIINLVLNASIHGYNNGGGLIDLVVRKSKTGLDISVEDYGKGISEEHLKHIFDPFFTTTRGMGGTGLGLSIAYNTVHQNLNGTIVCESKLGVGTKFIIHLPDAMVSTPKE